MSGDREDFEGQSTEEQDLQGPDTGAYRDNDATGEATATVDASEVKPAALSELDKARAESAANKDKYLRAVAELENFKKRTMKERSELIRYQGESIVVELLEVLDGFERAMAHSDSDPAAVIGGLRMIHKQFVDSLARFEIRSESSVGKQFDPHRQRAIGKEKRSGVAANEVIAELKKGYVYRDKLVRLGEVVVADGEEAD